MAHSLRQTCIFAFAEPDPLARESLTAHLSRAQANAVQAALARRVRAIGLPLKEVRAVAGAACAGSGDRLFAAAVLLQLPRLELISQAAAQRPAPAPYISGLRAFREGEALLAAVEGLASRPDVVFFNGHGVAHPRGCGLASHLGLALGLPSIGCARRPIARRATFSAGEPGDCAPLTDDQGKQIGAAVLMRRGSRPILISVGYLLDLGTAIALTLACARGHVFPEPLRLATAAARVQPH